MDCVSPDACERACQSVRAPRRWSWRYWRGARVLARCSRHSAHHASDPDIMPVAIVSFSFLTPDARPRAQVELDVDAIDARRCTHHGTSRIQALLRELRGGDQKRQDWPSDQHPDSVRDLRNANFALIAAEAGTPGERTANVGRGTNGCAQFRTRGLITHTK